MSETTTEKTEKKTVKKKEPKSFEEAMQRLDEIVSALEDGSAPLDASLAYYEEGIALVRYCGEKLDRAEQQVKLLARNEAGEIVEKDFPKDRNTPVSDD